MSKKALVSWGGWPGHKPEEWQEIVKSWLEEDGFEVDSSDDLDRFRDAGYLASLSLIVPVWTMGHMTPEQEQGLVDAVSGGVGLGGFHGMCAAFNDNLKYKFMTGGQMVGHPGDCDVFYSVEITDRDHEITAGLGDFEMRLTEQYFMHVDPGNKVLATTTFSAFGTVMPVIWTRSWGKGRVFYTTLGHAPVDFEVHEAFETLRRGLRWASR